MSYARLHKRLQDSAISARDAAKVVAEALVYYDAMVARVANPESLWAIPAASDVLAKTMLAISDARILAESSACDLYCVETQCFRLGVESTTLHEAEEVASKVCKKLKTLEGRWRKFTLSVQKIVTSPKHVQKTNLHMTVPKALAESATDVISSLREIKGHLDLVSAKSTASLATLEAHTLYLTTELLHHELEDE